MCAPPTRHRGCSESLQGRMDKGRRPNHQTTRLITHPTPSPFHLTPHPFTCREWVEDICPAYALTDVSAANPRAYGIGKSDGALSKSEMARAIHAAYAAAPIRPPFAAQKEFLRRCREHPTYGCSFFYGDRKWKAHEEQPDGTAKEVTHLEKVCVCAGYEGISILGHVEDPLVIETHDLADIGRWMTSRDGKIFAFTVGLEGERVIYIVTDLAPAIEQTMESYVEERVKFTGTGAPAEEGAEPPAPVDSSAVPRRAEDPGVGEIPPYVGDQAAPSPPWADKTVMPTMPPGLTGAGTGAAGGSTGTKSTAAILSAAERAASAAGLHPIPPAVAQANGPAPVHPPHAPPTARAHTETGETALLPQGWLEMRTAEGEMYYYNAEKNLTQWERPRPPGLPAVAGPLPEGWAAALDVETGEPYYFCEATGEVQWDRPELPEENLAAGWQVLRDEEGDEYFWNPTTGETTWDKPRAKP